MLVGVGSRARTAERMAWRDDGAMEGRIRGVAWRREGRDAKTMIR
jgi:hypothetical protein